MTIYAKTAVIAGGSSGIGLGIAQALAQRGASHLILLARTQSKLDRAAATIREMGTAVSTYSVDLGKAEQVTAVAEQIRTTIGIPDILINSAGSGAFQSILQADDTNMVQHIESTCYAGFFLTRAFIHDMVRRNSGNIVFVGSPAVNVNLATPAYIASRAAVKGLAKSVHYDLSNTNIAVTYAEPTLVYDSDYFTSQPGTLMQLPLLFREPQFRFLHQTAQSAGTMVANAIERNRRYTGHWISWVMRITSPLLQPFYEWVFKKTSLPANEGGPLFIRGGSTMDDVLVGETAVLK